jgi:ssDNA-binding Zn-finger/Zn-ribbon topoisomerase 1
VIKEGRFGRFKACSGYPDCKFRESLVKTETKMLDEKCPECGSPLVLKRGRYGAFVACSSYPKCKYIKKERQDTGIACPLECGGTLLRRKTKRGRFFFGCSSYPKCKFASWDEPVVQACPLCGRKVIFRKNVLRGEPYLYCKNEKCTFKEKHPQAEARDKEATPGRGRMRRRRPDKARGKAGPDAQAIDEFLAYLTHERNASPHTIAAYARDLGQLADYLEARGVRFSEAGNIVLRGFLAGLHERKQKKSTVARKLAAVRSFFEYCVRQKRLAENPAKLLATPRQEKHLPAFLSEEEMAAFLDVPGESRDPLVVREESASRTSLRRRRSSERLTGLTLTDVGFAERLVRFAARARRNSSSPFGRKAEEGLRAYV